MNVIYPKLYDHPYVSTYPVVPGIKQNIFFVTHEVEEDSQVPFI